MYKKCLSNLQPRSGIAISGLWEQFLYVRVFVPWRKIFSVGGGCQMAYFRTKNYNLGLEGLAMEDVGIYYGHLIYLGVILYILWLFV
jgi:hypothetical protein